MRIVIADDERLIRYSLRSMLEELSLPLEIVAEAANGEEFVSLVERYVPDLAFVDIRMPKLDGLEAIRRLKDRFPSTRWIILTSHSDFSYARDAIRLDAAAYLLKPVSPDELRENLMKIMGEHRRRIVSANRVFENRMTGMFSNTLPPDESAVFRMYRGGVFFFDSFYAEKTLAAFLLDFSGSVRKIIEEIVTKETNAALFTHPEGQLCVVSSWAENTSGEIVSSRFFNRIAELLRDTARPELATTFLAGGAVNSFSRLSDCIHGLIDRAALRIVRGPGSCITEDGLFRRENPLDEALLSYCRSLEALSEAARDASLLSFTGCLDGVSLAFAGIAKSLPDESLDRIRESTSAYLRLSLGCDCPCSPDSPDWKRTVRDYGVNMIERRHVREEESSGLVAGIREYIEKNYMNDIGIAQIAGEIGMTPNYLSSLFHRRTGTTLNKFLTKVRMLKAQETLARTDVPIREAAALSGYQSTRHFARLFKQTFGVYPSDYRKSLSR